MTQPAEGNAKKTAPKGATVESSAKADSKRDKKEKKGNTFLLIIIILILTSIVSFGAIFMFNFAGLKAETSMRISKIPVVGKLMKPVLEKKNFEQIAKEEIDQENRNIAIKTKALNDKEKELDKKSKELESREKALAEKELQVNDTLQKLSDKLTSIQEQVAYLEKVDNAKAMNIIMSMDDKATAVQILRNMKKDKASAILALMDPLQAAQILEDLADQPPVAEPVQGNANF